MAAVVMLMMTEMKTRKAIAPATSQLSQPLGGLGEAWLGQSKLAAKEKKRRCRKTERMEGKFRGSADLGRLIAIRMEAPSRVHNFGRQAGKPQPEQSKHRTDVDGLGRGEAPQLRQGERGELPKSRTWRYSDAAQN